MIMVVAVWLLAGTSSLQVAFAQSQRETKRDQRNRAKPRKLGEKEKTKLLRDDVTTIPGHEAGTGIAVFLGLTGGPLWIETDDPSYESNKDGFFLAGKAISSFYTDNWVTDLGMGWFYGELSAPEPGSGENPPPNPEFEYIPGPVMMALNAGLIEITPKFRISQNWQIGLHTNLFFSTNSDTGFNGIFQEQDNPDKFSALVGAQVMFGVPKTEADWRAGLEYLTDVTVQGRQLHLATLTFQFGLPLVSPDVVKKERELLTEKSRIERFEKERVERKVIIKEVTKFIFERQQILFSRRGAILHPDSQSFLIELAQILQQNDRLWEDLTIESHTSADLPYRNAENLSSKRSTAVRAALVSVGLDPERVSARGFGNTVPLREGSPGPRDERTVFSFGGVKDIRDLSAKIAAIRAKYRIPETCSIQEGCL